MEQAEVDVQGCDGIQPFDSFESASFPGVYSKFATGHYFHRRNTEMEQVSQDRCGLDN